MMICGRFSGEVMSFTAEASPKPMAAAIVCIDEPPVHIGESP
jgi:hypothetical protein